MARLWLDVSSVQDVTMHFVAKDFCKVSQIAFVCTARQSHVLCYIKSDIGKLMSICWLMTCCLDADSITPSLFWTQMMRMVCRSMSWKALSKMRKELCMRNSKSWCIFESGLAELPAQLQVQPSNMSDHSRLHVCVLEPCSLGSSMHCRNVS